MERAYKIAKKKRKEKPSGNDGALKYVVDMLTFSYCEACPATWF